MMRLFLLIVLITFAQCAPVHFGRSSLPASARQLSAQRTESSRSEMTRGIAADPVGDHPLSCGTGALTCIRVTPPAGMRGPYPITFGEPFAPDDVPAGATLMGRTRSGETVAIQMDEPSSYDDHSLRFAVLSAVLPTLPADGETISLFVQHGGGAPDTPRQQQVNLALSHDTRVVLDVFSAQVTAITPGNLAVHGSGAPFSVGDTITVHLGDKPTETFTVTVTAKEAGSSYATLRTLAMQLVNAINRSSHYQAYNLPYSAAGYVMTRDGARPFTATVETTSAAPVTVTQVQEYVPPQRYFASSRAMLQEAEQKGSLHTWLSGPIASEFMLAAPLALESGAPHARLMARMNVRAYQAPQQVRTNVVVEDLGAFDAAPHDWQYNVEIDQDGKEVFHQDNVAQYHHGRWHKVIWSGARVQAGVQYETRYFLNSRAVPHYDSTFAVSSRLIEEELKRLDRSDAGLMGNALVGLYFPTTGARADIGPLPDWTALYLMSMDSRARAVMIANADASGSAPIHYRDRRTGLPVRLDDHPQITLSADDRPDTVPHTSYDWTPWTVDAAHQPSLVYVPYLVTGDEYYLEEIQFWANWNMLELPPFARQAAAGILVDQIQERGQAWGLRAVADAAYITPDTDPLKAYFVAKLSNNINSVLQRYAQRSNPLGLDVIVGRKDAFAPWQLGFQILTVSQIAAQGNSGAVTWLHWLGQLAVGLWTNEQNGYCRMNAPAYWLKLRPSPNAPLFTTWSELSKANFPDETECPTMWRSRDYTQIARAAMAALSDYKIPGAHEVYNFLASHRSGMLSDATWQITPR